MNSKNKWGKVAWALMIMGVVGLSFSSPAQDLPVKNGDKIAFLGDSITAGGMGSPSGYCKLVINGLEANGVKATAIGAGVSGHKSDQMLERLERDVLNKKPEWMTLSCGVNDVWHGAKGIPLDQYKKNIAEIIQRAQAAGIKVMILTSTMIGEDQPNPNNQKLIAYNDYLRELAKEKKCLLADLNADMQEALKQAGSGKNRGNVLTGDGVHMNPLGNQMMATGILKAFGLSAAQIQKAQESWLNIRDACEVGGKMKLTLRQFNQLNALAAKENKSVDSLINAELSKSIDSLLKTAPPVSAPAQQK
ncbi:MAG: SGNH/GDSL hydrolase family protein [Candidatus Sumerlaeota bacterium]|nr:SGNH/GDSL hydrolase family protein [Candidatus Sumerlaeota bacterium]